MRHLRLRPNEEKGKKIGRPKAPRNFLLGILNGNARSKRVLAAEECEGLKAARRRPSRQSLLEAARARAAALKARLESEQGLTRASLARELGVSRARITRMLGPIPRKASTS